MVRSTSLVWRFPRGLMPPDLRGSTWSGTVESLRCQCPLEVGLIITWAWETYREKEHKGMSPELFFCIALFCFCFLSPFPSTPSLTIFLFCSRGIGVGAPFVCPALGPAPGWKLCCRGPPTAQETRCYLILSTDLYFSGPFPEATYLSVNIPKTPSF